MEQLATWEIFLNELKRNISPKKSDIQHQLGFLVSENLCGQATYEKLVQVREMASYEQAISEFLHPPFEWKQANIKAEILHFGTLTEALLEILLIKLYSLSRITLADIQYVSPTYDMSKIAEKPLTFNQLVTILKKYFDVIVSNIKITDKDRSKSLASLSFAIIELKDERNKIHLGDIHPINRWEVIHEEYRLVTIRRKFDYLIYEIQELIK